jgi:polynucleotide 5'-hydroxyl-kinase GRC3/NOL9
VHCCPTKGNRIVSVGTQQPLQIPEAWTHLPVEGTHGVILLMGAPNTGKSTLARYLFGLLAAQGRRVAYLDGDPGQSILGPPTTLTLAVAAETSAGRAAAPARPSFPPTGPYWRRFLGATSPRAHMLPFLVAAARLVQAGHSAGADVIIYDTCGFVDASFGGLHLKLAEIDLLRPALVIGLAHGEELDPLLAPLRYSHRTRVEKLRPAVFVQPRTAAERQAHRAARFANYFSTARVQTIDWRRRAVLPSPEFAAQRLLALEDDCGFTLGLGIVLGADMAARRVSLLTPLAAFDHVDTLNLGHVLLDMQTFRDQRIIQPER